MSVKLPNFFSRFTRQPAKPLTVEVAPSSLYEFFTKFDKSKGNPDKVLAYESNGTGYELYRDMRKKDPEVESLIQTRTRTVAARSWELVPFDDSPAASDQAEFVEQAIASIPEWTNKCQKMIEAFYFGFTVAEKMFTLDDEGFWTIADIRDRKQDYFKFGHQGELMYRKTASSLDYVEVPERKFVVCQYNTMGENPYGTPAAQILYFYWFVKKECFKMWSIGVEKFGMPTVAAFHAPGITSDEKTTLQDSLATLMSDTSIVVSDNVKIELLEAVRQSASPYEALQHYVDSKYAKLLLGQEGTTSRGSVGSLASDRVKQDVQDDIIQGDAELLMSVVNTSIVRDLIDFNFPPVKGLGYPTYVIKYEPEKDLNGIVDRISKLVPMGMPIPVSWVREQLTIPEPIDGEEVLQSALTNMFPTEDGGSSPSNTKSPSSPPQEEKKDEEETKDNRLKLVTFAEDAEGYMPELPPVAPYNPDVPVAVQPGYHRKRYYVGTGTMEIRDRFKSRLRAIYGGLTNVIIDRFANVPDQVLDLIDDLVVREFQDKLKRPMTEATERTIRYAARDLARQMEMKFNADVFKSLAADYLKLHAYDKGVVDGIGDTLKELLSSNIEDVFASGGELSEMIGQLRTNLDILSAAKVEQIAVTEVRQAANWATLEMGKRSKMPLEAYFIVDPASCPVCQLIASKNPYTLGRAQSMETHPNCNDYWALVGKE